jgi:hypothetical protein
MMLRPARAHGGPRADPDEGEPKAPESTRLPPCMDRTGRSPGHRGCRCQANALARGARDGTIRRRRDAWRLSHKSPSDPVRRTVMGRPMFKATTNCNQMGRDCRQRRESRYVPPPLRFLSFSYPVTRQPPWKASAVVARAHARNGPCGKDETNCTQRRHAPEAVACGLARSSTVASV